MIIIILIAVLIKIFNGLFMKGSIKMIDMYYRLVKAGLRTIQKVPDQFRAAVIEDLALDGNNKSIEAPKASNIIVHR